MRKMQIVLYFLLTNIVDKILKEAIINGLKAPGLLNLDLSE